MTREYEGRIRQDFVVLPGAPRWRPDPAPTPAPVAPAPVPLPTTADGHAAKFVGSLVADDGTPLEFEIRADGYVNASKLFKGVVLSISKYLNKEGTWATLHETAAAHQVPTGVYMDEREEKIKVSPWRYEGVRTAFDTPRFPNGKEGCRKTRGAGGASDSMGAEHRMPLVQWLGYAPIGQRATWVHEDVAVLMAQAIYPRIQQAIAQVIVRYAKGEVTTGESGAVARLVAAPRRRVPQENHRTRMEMLQKEAHTQQHVGAKRPRPV